MSELPPERREAPRQSVELHVEFRHLGRPREGYAEVCKNISAGGVFLATTVVLPVGTRVELLVAAGPRMPPVHVEAEVLRVEAEPVGTASAVTSPARGMALRFLPKAAAEVVELQRLAQAVAGDDTQDVQEGA